MSLSKSVFAAAALALAASAHADITLLSEGFDNGATLPGWTQTIAQGVPGWFGGYDDAFASQAGVHTAYIAADFSSGPTPSGNCDLWLITPEVNLLSSSMLSFYTRTADAGFFDQLEVRYSAGSGTALGNFTNVLTTIGDAGTFPLEWQHFNVLLDSSFAGSGRFAFRYTGNAADADFIGIDSVNLTTVPEPASLVLLGLGFAGFTLARRRQRRA